MFHINIGIVPDGKNGYGIDIQTNIPDEDVIIKILKDAVNMWDERSVTVVEEEDVW